MTALNAYNEALFLVQTATNLANSAVATWGALSSSGSGQSVITGTSLAKQNNQTPQQTYFQLFFGYYTSRTLFTVQTPWAVFQNMAIQSIRAVQDAETNVITDFECTFKQMNFASTMAVIGNLGSQYSGVGRQPNQISPNNYGGQGSLGQNTTFSTSPGIAP